MLDSVFYLVFLCGALAGCIAVDFVTRAKDARDRKQSAAELKEVLEKLGSAHNNVIEQMKTLGDKVNAHEFMLKSKSESGNVTGITGKRF